MKKTNTFLRNRVKYSLFLIAGVGVSFVITNNAFADDYSLTLTSSGSQSINVSGSSGTAISSDSINVSTTCRYGYNFTINTSVNNNNLYLNGDSSNNASGTYFSPVDGTTALNSSTNKWGYYYNSSASNTPTSTSIFSPVPTLNNPATVKTPLTTPASSNINDNFKIYYGVNSAPEMSVGTYRMIPDTNNSNNDGTIVYTATMAENCITYTVHYNPTGTNMGTSVTGTGTVSDQTMYEGVATNLTNSYFTGPTINGTTYYFTGWNTAQDGSGTSYTRGQSVTDLTTVGNTITLYAQWTDCPGGYVCYSGGNANGIEGAMGNQIINSLDTSVTFLASNYSRDGYGFASWNTKADGSGINYGPSQDLDFTAGKYSTGGLKLYAKWVVSTGNMQSWTGCNNMNIGDVTALKDTRNNEVYAVAKLADNKCWMIENLRLADKDSNNNDVILSSSNTHNPLLPLTNIYDISSTSYHLSPSSSLAYDANTAPEGWCDSDTVDCYDQSRVLTRNITNRAQNPSHNNNRIYSYGNYYNWYSATAGNGKYSTNINNQPTAGDICPAGWHLPTGGDKNNKNNSDYWILSTAVAGAEPVNTSSEMSPYYTNGEEGLIASRGLRSYPNNFVFGGGVTRGSVFNLGFNGHYWTSNAYSNYGAYYFYIGDQFVRPGTFTHNDKYSGFTVRCIAET